MSDGPAPKTLGGTQPMPDSPKPLSSGPVAANPLVVQFENALAKLEETSSFAKTTARGPVLDIACRLLAQDHGAAALYANAEAIEHAGLFTGSEWDHPEILQPSLTTGTLEDGDRHTATLEMLSELRLLAVAQSDFFHPKISSEQAQHFLAQVLALNVDRLFGGSSEVDRQRGTQAVAVRNLFTFIAERIGYGEIFDKLIDEIERILGQRPTMVDDVKTMITRIAACLHDPNISVGPARRGADRLVSALFGPTPASREDPGLTVYAERLTTLDDSALHQEARGFARAMHDTGLVSPYHPVFIRHVSKERPDLVSQALGLSTTGAEALLCYKDLVTSLIEAAVTPETTQAVYGLALMLERGILFDPAIGPALWGQINLKLLPTATAALTAGFGNQQPASTILLAGVLNVLGQPLGIGQGNNPTCQSVRALSMWALAAPDYLLHLVRRAARDDEIVMFFEGHRLSSAELTAGAAAAALTDVDPVSTVLVPHLDRIYKEMGRLCDGRDGDPHAWINREMHGWWVGRETALAVDLPTGKLTDYENFVRRFFGLYHPLYNGNQPVIHPQPAGIAITDSRGRFIGWHAITILRVGLGPKGNTRVYFFNPNNDSGQDWSQGVVVSTEGNGERFGESSLPIGQFASRLYLFHYDPCDEGDVTAVPAEEIAEVEAMARATWAADR